MALMYNVTFIGDYAHITTTVTVEDEHEDNNDAIIDAATTTLTDYYGIDPIKTGLGSVDIEIDPT